MADTSTMRKIFCHVAAALAWANRCGKGQRGTDYRCTKCGEIHR